jgi:hypothetical protein
LLFDPQQVLDALSARARRREDHEQEADHEGR